jgi:hypothetical protein
VAAPGVDHEKKSDGFDLGACHASYGLDSLLESLRCRKSDGKYVNPLPMCQA